MARAELYVDPSIAGNSGTGTSGDPYGDFQYLLDNEAFDVTNGTRINVKAGTDEILVATLDFTTNFTNANAPSYNNPGLIIQGYTTAAGDGGIGGIDGDGSYGPMAQGALTGTALVDMHLHNAGAATIVRLGSYSGAINCELNNSSGTGYWGSSVGNHVLNCYLHDIGDEGIINAHATSCYLQNGVKSFTTAININGSEYYARRNIISLTGNSRGIYTSITPKGISGNSIFSTAAGGGGVGIKSVSSSRGLFLYTNNLVEGFATNIQTLANNLYVLVGNAVYNGGTNYSTLGKGEIEWDGRDNETLGSSPFAKSGSDTFANRFSYFEPADVGNVRGGAYPSGSRLDKGAVQHADVGGGVASILGGGNLSGGFV